MRLVSVVTLTALISSASAFAFAENDNDNNNDKPLLRTVHRDFASVVGAAAASGFPDLSCFRQVWNSDAADTECPTKKDKKGGACVWCAGPETLKAFAKAGACVTVDQTSFLTDKGMACGAATKKPDVEDEEDAAAVEALRALGFDLPDVSCFRQVWKSDIAEQDCGTKKDKSGGACRWCDAKKVIKEYVDDNEQIKELMNKMPQAKEILDKAGFCVTTKQTSFLEEKGMTCADAATKPVVE